MLIIYKESFFLPLLKEQGMTHKLGLGRLRKVIPVNQNQVLVVEAGGASLFDFNNSVTQWKIE